MLQNVRDNLKGTVAIVVISLLVIPMVVTGIGGSSFFGSVVGTNAAKVNQKNVTNVELSRAISNRQEQMKSQGVDPASDQLKEENLREPVLQSLTRRAALVTSSEKGGMGIADSKIDSTIIGYEAFHTDGKFDRQLYQRRLGQFGYSPTSFKAVVTEDLVLQQSQGGITGSAFVTDLEVNAVIALTEEKRSFTLVTIPSKELKKGIAINDEAVGSYYEANQDEFAEPEKVSLSYLELSVDDLMADIQVLESEVKQSYEVEKSAHEPGAAEVEIAHILLEKKEDASELVLAADIKSRLEKGEDFAELVKQYSIDEGTRETGGDLGVLIPEVFSEAFESAALSLQEGEVSEAVETDAGLHLIKAISRSEDVFPSFEEKKVSIEDGLKRAQAEEIYASALQTLEDMTFSADNLQLAATELKLEVKHTELFAKSQGTGVASNEAVRNAAFSDAIKLDARNSPKIQLGAGHAIVIRNKEHKPEHIKDLELVKDSIMETLTQEELSKLLEVEAESLVADLKSGADLKALAEEKGYTVSVQDKVKRFGAPVDYFASMATFKMPAGTVESPTYDSLQKSDGDYLVIKLTEVIQGSRDDVPEAQLAAIKNQLKQQNATADLAAYESALVADSKIKIY